MRVKMATIPKNELQVRSDRQSSTYTCNIIMTILCEWINVRMYVVEPGGVQWVGGGFFWRGRVWGGGRPCQDSHQAEKQ